MLQSYPIVWDLFFKQVNILMQVVPVGVEAVWVAEVRTVFWCAVIDSSLGVSGVFVVVLQKV